MHLINKQNKQTAFSGMFVLRKTAGFTSTAVVQDDCNPIGQRCSGWCYDNTLIYRRLTASALPWCIGYFASQQPVKQFAVVNDAKTVQVLFPWRRNGRLRVKAREPTSLKWKRPKVSIVRDRPAMVRVTLRYAALNERSHHLREQSQTTSKKNETAR